jgi:hypothetical protein
MRKLKPTPVIRMIEKDTIFIFAAELVVVMAAYIQTKRSLPTNLKQHHNPYYNKLAVAVPTYPGG